MQANQHGLIQSSSVVTRAQYTVSQETGNTIDKTQANDKNFMSVLASIYIDN